MFLNGNFVAVDGELARVRVVGVAAKLGGNDPFDAHVDGGIDECNLRGDCAGGYGNDEGIIAG